MRHRSQRTPASSQCTQSGPCPPAGRTCFRGSAPNRLAFAGLRPIGPAYDQFDRDRPSNRSDRPYDRSAAPASGARSFGRSLILTASIRFSRTDSTLIE
jgi:hypothetical protein